MASPMRPSSGSRLSGSWASVTSSSPAPMPQPMSTPTALGITAPLVGITEPTVAPMPTWASGMRATWPSTIGRRAAFSAWRMVPSSTSLPQEMSLSLIVVAIVFSLQYVTTEQASDAYRRSDSNGHWAGFGPAASALGYGGVDREPGFEPGRDAGPKPAGSANSP